MMKTRLAAEVVQIGPPRLTAGLDRTFRLDLAAHLEVHGPFPRLTLGQLITMAERVDLRGRGGAAFPPARTMQAVSESSNTDNSETVGLGHAAEGKPPPPQRPLL